MALIDGLLQKSTKTFPVKISTGFVWNFLGEHGIGMNI
jgi:hypothetical protein